MRGFVQNIIVGGGWVMSSSSSELFLEDFDLDLPAFVFPELFAGVGGVRRSDNVSSGGLQRR